MSQYIQQIKELFPESEIINLSFIDDPKYLKHQSSQIARLVPLKPPGFLEKLYNIAVHTLLLRRWPLQVSVFYNRKTHKEIKAIIDAEQPEFIIYDMVRVAEYWTNGPNQKILSYDDLLSLRYQRQLQWFKYIPSVFGGFSNKLPQSLKRLTSLKFVQKWLIAYESRLLLTYEKRVAGRFQHLIFTSPKEADSFRQTVNHRSCHGIPMKFDPDLLKTEQRRNYDRNKLVFVGKMDIPHNSSAVFYFCEHIWHEVKLKMPEAMFYIVGKNPTKEVKQLEQKYPDVFVTGEVDDVERYVSDSALMIAPLLFGTGIKTKIIEAMSWGVPVVTNPVGSEGINANHNEDLFICTTDEDMVNNVLLLLSNDEVNDRLSRNSIHYVLSHFSSSVTKKNLKLILS
ncbi:glycosyltransferase [Paenibacillus glycinis]|uniref:glycosyltransferase n=1 Tax=Paenibacillus glycinis TaxID=2697035 RepID=UPI001F3179EC|nr:glycosyltransferase [Paenibacillus glycinis]